MSWLVETLLLNREQLKLNPDLDSDDYNNLLLVEKAISELVSMGNIAPFEVAILNYVISNKSFTTLESVLGVSRNTVSKYFREICDRVSFYLGFEFTDEGYLAYMKKQHKLENDDVERMRKHMQGRYRHTIRRTVNDN